MAATPEKPADSCAYVVGDDGLSRWSDTHADAWVGLLETHRQVTRALGADLEARFGLTLSALEILGRLAADHERRLRLSTLAGETRLSLSRVSRIVDTLEDRGLVERQQCPNDARAMNCYLLDAGLELARDAQRAHFAAVQERSFEQLSPVGGARPAPVFSRSAPSGARACRADWRLGGERLPRRRWPLRRVGQRAQYRLEALV